MTRRGVFVNRDGSTEAWDGDSYVALGSMRIEPPKPEQMVFPPPPQLYMVIEEYPPLTIDEFVSIAEDRRKQNARRKRFDRLLRRAAELAAGKNEADE